MEVSSWLTGRRGVALPFSDFCSLLGSVGSDPTHQKQSLEALWPRILELGRQRGWRTIELRSGPPPTPEAQPSATFHGHILELSGGESELSNRLHPSVRRAIRKARQSELRVESTHALDALHAYYALHIRTRQRHGLPPQPFTFFLKLYDQMIATGNGFICLVRLGVPAIAGAIFLHAGRTAVFKYGASDPAHPTLRANDLLFWETIRQLAADGFATLHFGRTDLDHEGLRRFKLGWGTREEPIHYYTYDLRANAFVVATRRVNGRLNALFTRLPPAVNRLLGSLIYRHLD
jgi:lipid II:glycine glycyltransferase (peptidoglycan interpeptide bridge formation enzyme)